MAPSAEAVFREGRLDDAVRAASEEVRADPSDARARSFLFELLCFAGEYDRAEKHLEVLGRAGPHAQMGAMLFRATLSAERARQSLFAEERVDPADASEAVTGSLNGEPFSEISDADFVVGARLEVFVAGGYRWINFRDVARIEMDPPRLLRDLLWSPARLKLGPALRDVELGEVLVPVMTPLAWRHEDDRVRLGRDTVWQERSGALRPVGQKLLLVDDALVPLLSVRVLEFDGLVRG